MKGFSSSRGSLVGMLSLFSAVALTLAGSIIQGQRSNRWGEPANVRAAAEKLNAIPTEFGDWQLQSVETFDPSTIAMLRCYESLNRNYIHRKTGKRISAIVLVGPPGPMVAHTPEICYAGRDYAIETAARHVDIMNGSTKLGEFTALKLRSRGLLAQLVSVFYAWNDGHGWRTPADPRLSFGAAGFLYKVQIAESSLSKADSDENACELFLKDFLPVVDLALPAVPPDEIVARLTAGYVLNLS